MKLKNILLGPDQSKKRPVLLAVTPPRTGERTLLGVENLLQSIAVPEPFSLELAGTADGVTLMARCIDDQVVRGQLSAHYPQARIWKVADEDDPLRIDEGEQAWSIILRAGGPEYVPLRTFRDDDLLDPGSDPLIALLGALTTLRPGERTVARLMLRSLGPDWSQAHMDKAHKRPGSEQREPSYTYQTKPLQLDGVTMAVLGAVALAAIRGYLWVQDGEIWKAALLGTGMSLGLAAGGWAWWRWKRSRSRVEDPILIREKVSRIAFDAEIQVTAIMPETTRPQRAAELLEPVAAAYRHFDNPAGARFRVDRIQPFVPDPSMFHFTGGGLFGGRSVLGVREVAALWHPPGAGDETPLVERSGARGLTPSARGVRGGALVGDTTAGKPMPIRFPEDLLRRHHLYVARTRMGKSTLMHHLVSHKMREKAEGRDGDAIVVIDPHADLVGGLLEQVPEEIADRVRLIDLADESRSPGINLLDTRIFADRDRTADSVVRVAKGLWEQWGPRMQSILEQTVKTLHEANEHHTTDDHEQHTILDGLKLLSNDPFRNSVLAKVSDPYLLEWWARDFSSWHRQYRAEALAPVQTRLSYYASSKRARAIIGQRRSTIDMRRTILDGGILFVSTAQGTVGRDVAALVGASLLNLVDAVIREQGGLPPERRRGALVVVDEMQSMPGVDYESMLSELGKFGASFVLATQSLAKLDDLSRTMRDTLLANVGCLAIFQVAGSDARHLVWELGKDRVTEDDIVSLPVHHCYVRATVGKERMPAFSMMVRRPEPGDPEIASRIRAATFAYTVSARQAAYRDAEGHGKVDEYRKGVDDLKTEGGEDGKNEAARGPGAVEADQQEEGGGQGDETMRPERSEAELLRALAAMPFMDRLEMVAVSGYSRGMVYEVMRRLEDEALAASVPHAADLVPPTRRYFITGAGIGSLAEVEDAGVDEMLHRHPTSVQWLRVLMERLDALAVIYRLAAAVSNVAHPIRLRLYRAMPMDAAIELPGGRTVGVVRQGLTADRSAFSKRILRLSEGPVPGAVLLLMPDEVRLRHARRLLTRTRLHALLALERDAALAGPGDRIWRPAAVHATLDLRYVLRRLEPAGELPAEAPLSKTTRPGDGAPDAVRALPGPPQTRREAHARPDLRLAMDRAHRTRELVERLGAASVPAHHASRRFRPRHQAHRRERTAGPDRPRARPPGSKGPRLRGPGEEAVERRSHR